MSTPYENWLNHLERLARPPLEALAAGRLKASMPVEHHPDVNDRDQYTHLECLGRLLAGIGPFLACEQLEGEAERLRGELAELARAGLDRATDPASDDDMNFNTGGQPLVDAAFLAIGLLRGRGALWDPLDERVKDRLVECLKSSRVIRPGFNNWLLFSAAIEAMLCAVGESYDPIRIDYAIRQHEQWYLGGAVYGDGPHYAADYYNSYVIQPFLLDVLDAAGPMRDDWHALAGPMRERAAAYAAMQEQMIQPDGSFCAVGRSITYRCGAFQLLAHQAWKQTLGEDVKPAAVRGALTGVIDRTLGAPGTYDDEGWLRIGLCGHQPALADRYISTGSLYLAATALLPLGLSTSAPFWSDADERWTSCGVWGGEDVARPNVKP